MELPARYGHYVLLERIAVGGMGEIFRASYAGLAGFERPCAIKRILPHLSDDEEFADRLIHEAKIAVQLSHGNIVQIYELGKIDKEYFIAMEWVDGPDLSTLLIRAKAKESPLPISLAVHIVREVARALDHAHKKTDADGNLLGIVHRDVSPQNILLSVDGAVKLGDFGIARAGGIARKFSTDMGAVLGKRRYMSPEQRRGETVDSRADVYALGAILYELVSGEPPDPEGALPLSLRSSDLAEELEALAMSALEQDPGKRMPSAAVLVEGLDRVFMRLASAPGAIRDPSVELGRFVQKICPPGEKRPNRRSLTARMRDAMPKGIPDDARMNPPQDRTAGVIPEGTADIAVARDTVSGTPAPAPLAPAAIGAVGSVGGGVIPESTAAFSPRREATIDAELPDEEREETALDEVPASDGSTVTLVISNVMQRPRAAGASTVMRVREPAVTTLGAPPTSSPFSSSNDPLAQTRLVSHTPRPQAPRLDAPVSRTDPTEPAVTRIARTPSTPRAKLLSEEPARDRMRKRIAAMAAVGFVVLFAAVLVGGWMLPQGTSPTPAPASPTPIARVSPRRVPTPIRTREAVAPTPAPTRPRPTPTKVAAIVTPRLRVTPTSTPRPAADGTLQLGATPWANLFLDGKPLGTLATEVKVRPGPHTVVFENPKLGRRTRTVNVTPGETLKVLVDFRNPE